MEIERLVSGELTKSIEQAATLLGDLERKMAGLKAELVQAAAAAGVRTPGTLQTLQTQGVYGQVNPYGQGLVSPYAQQSPYPQIGPFPQGVGAPQFAPQFGQQFAPTGIPPIVGPQPATPFGGVPYGSPFGVPQQSPFGVGINPGIAPGFGVQPTYPLAQQQAWLNSLWAREALLRQGMAVPNTQGYGNISSLGQGLTGVPQFQPQFQQGIHPQQYGYIW